jgi:hypothetical protein
MAHQQQRQPPEQRQRRSRQAVSPALMGSKPIDECEIKVRGEWLRIEIEAALERYAGGLKRRPECHGPVRAHKVGTTDYGDTDYGDTPGITAMGWTAP